MPFCHWYFHDDAADAMLWYADAYAITHITPCYALLYLMHTPLMLSLDIRWLICRIGISRLTPFIASIVSLATLIALSMMPCRFMPLAPLPPFLFSLYYWLLYFFFFLMPLIDAALLFSLLIRRLFILLWCRLMLAIFIDFSSSAAMLYASLYFRHLMLMFHFCRIFMYIIYSPWFSAFRQRFHYEASLFLCYWCHHFFQPCRELLITFTAAAILMPYAIYAFDAALLSCWCRFLSAFACYFRDQII